MKFQEKKQFIKREAVKFGGTLKETFAFSGFKISAVLHLLFRKAEEKERKSGRQAYKKLCIHYRTDCNSSQNKDLSK